MKVNRLLLFLAMTLGIQLLSAQTRTLTGRVTQDGTGEPLPGTQLFVKDTFIGTTSDAEGYYSLDAPPEDFLLVVAFVGYKTAELTVAAGVTTLDISMISDVLRSEEVVVTGLASSVKRRNLANAVASVSAADLIPAPAQTLDAALSGKFAGITVRQNTGAPGGGMSVNLRGVSTIQGATQPLYVIDGVIINNAANQSGIDVVSAAAGAGSARPQGQPSNRIGDINPQDIESVEVLKGASAAAIYGSKAANGVIIITTKRGKPGDIQFRISQRTGATSILKKQGHRSYDSYADAVDVYGADLSALGLNQAGQDAYATFRALVGIDSVNNMSTEALDSKFKSNWANVDIDYEDELYGETGLLTETNISAGGGTVRTRYYAAATIKNEEGIIKGTGYSKYSGQLNLDHRFNDRATLSISTNLARTESDRGITGNDNTNTTFGFSLAFTPSFVDIRKDADGNYPDHPSNPSNPLHTRDVLINNEIVFRSIGSFNFKYKLLDNADMSLDFVATGGGDFYNQSNLVHSPPELQFERNGDQPGQSIQANTTSINSNLSLSLVNRLNMGTTSLVTSAGAQWETADLNQVTVVASNTVVTQTNVDQAANVFVLQSIRKQQDRGFFIQTEATLNDVIYLTAAMRADRSSTIGDTEKFFTFPKAAASIRLSELGFWEPLSGLSDEFKIRFAYGQTGNLPTAAAKFTALNPLNIGGNAGLVTSTRRGDEGIRPEITTEIEYGIDASLFGGFGSIELSMFNQKITDLLLFSATPSSSGFSSEVINGGEMTVKGIEASLNLNLVRSSAFEWATRINFYRTRSVVDSLVVDPFNLGGFATFLGTYRIEEGWSPTAIVGSETETVITQTADGPDTSEVHIKLGDETPDFQMSFNNIFRIGPFGVRFLLDWKKGGDIINLGALLTDLGGTTADYDQEAKFLVRGGASDGVSDTTYTVEQAGPGRLGLLGTATAPYVGDGSYLKLRELAIEYNVPQSIVGGILGGVVDYVTLSVTGRNLWMMTDYTGYDPEVSQFGNVAIGGSVDTIPFPSSKSIFFDISFGL